MLSSLRALPRPVWILFLGTFLNKFGTFVVPFLTLYLTRQGYSLASAGMAIGAYGVGHLVASLLGGHLADTIGRRKTIVLSMFSAAVAMMLLSQARSLPVIILLTAFAGLTGELYRPAASALLADLVSPGERVTAFAAYRIAFNAGWAFGPATAGFLTERGYFWLFAGDAATSVLFGVVALFSLPRGVRHPPGEAGWTEALQAFRTDKRFHQVLIASFAIALVFFQMSSTFGLHVTALGFSAATYGALISLNGVLVVLCELPLTTITRRFAARDVMAAGYLLVGAGFALNLFAHTVPALAACMIVFHTRRDGGDAGLVGLHRRPRSDGLAGALHGLVWPDVGVRIDCRSCDRHEIIRVQGAGDASWRSGRSCARMSIILSGGFP